MEYFQENVISKQSALTKEKKDLTKLKDTAFVHVTLNVFMYSQCVQVRSRCKI